MEMTGEQLIPASQADTWTALNDPETLKACIPGCESIEKSGENEYVVQMTARVGPVSAKFKGKMALSNIQPPNSYAIAFEGQGGVAGFAKGGAEVSLTTQEGGTLLSYKAKANVGGKLAQIGSRLVDAAAAKVAGEFFTAFNEKVGKPQAEKHGDGHADAHDDHHPAPVPRDPDLPTINDSTLSFFAAGTLVVFGVALVTLI
jgi:carbon monoxide dehydrogenase subunit G